MTTVLLLGATGAVGSELAATLASSGADVVRCARRGPSVVRWDVGAASPPPPLKRRFDVVVNAVASTRWNNPPEVAHRCNVATVEALSGVVAHDTHLVHLSTSFATGLTGSVSSERLDDYRNTYEWSKAASERAAADLGCPVTIVRFPLVLGRRSDGHLARYNGLYRLAQAMITGLLPAYVGDPASRIDIVPADGLGGGLGEITLGPVPGAVRTVTLGAGPTAPAAGDAVEVMATAIDRWRADHGHDPIPRPPFVDPERWDRFLFPFATPHLSRSQHKAIELLSVFRPYLERSLVAEPDVVLDGGLDALDRSIGVWAARHRSLASLSARPWTSRAEEPAPGARSGAAS